MKKRQEKPMQGRALELLAHLLRTSVRVEESSTSPSELVVHGGKHRFLLDLQPRASIAALAMHLQQQAKNRTARQRIVAVPFMTRAGADLCEQAGWNWIDLAGNAEINASNLRIHVRGCRPRIGRPKVDSPFAPAASRVVRLLLFEPAKAFTQKELVAGSQLAQGFVSKIIRSLTTLALVEREGRHIKVRDANLLLRAWQEQYRFDKHEVVRGHFPTRNGEALLRAASEALAEQKVEHAATGLAGAWLLSHFAMFRLVSVFVRQLPDLDAWRRHGFREEVAGANLWLVVPNDEGVFMRASLHDHVNCVHPLQVYLDLASQPERSHEAAAQLRATHLTWIKSHD